MSRSRKRGYDKRGNLDWQDKSTRSYWSRERKWARKFTNRKARNAARQKIRTMVDPDEVDVDPVRSTQGWITH